MCGSEASMSCQARSFAGVGVLWISASNWFSASRCAGRKYRSGEGADEGSDCAAASAGQRAPLMNRTAAVAHQRSGMRGTKRLRLVMLSMLIMPTIVPDQADAFGWAVVSA